MSEKEHGPTRTTPHIARVDTNFAAAREGDNFNNTAWINPTNPFRYNHTLHAGCFQTCKMVVLGLLFFPLRFIIFIVALVWLWLAASLSLCCSSGSGAHGDEDGRPVPRSQPISRCMIRISARLFMWSLGYLWITENGEKDPEAPVVVSNHVTFLDAFYFANAMLPMAVGKAELLDMPIFGTIAKSLQTITVSRDSANSRQEVAEEICRRTQWTDTQSDEMLQKYGRWPPLLIFPEATTANATAVIEFKHGAFMPLVPVQPVVLDFRQKHLDVSWVGDMSLPLTLLRMMCQVYNRLEVTYLPTVHPPPPPIIKAEDEKVQEEEESAVTLSSASPLSPPSSEQQQKQRVAKFAEEVRTQMAAALGVPMTNHNFLDVILARDVDLLRLPQHAINVEMGKYPDGLQHAKTKLWEFAALDKDKNGTLNSAEFAELLGFEDPQSEESRQICEAVISLWDKDGDGCINFNEFLLFSAWRQLRRVSLRRQSSATSSAPLSREGSTHVVCMSPSGGSQTPVIPLSTQPDATLVNVRPANQSSPTNKNNNGGSSEQSPSELGAFGKQDTLSSDPSTSTPEDEELKLAFALCFGAFDTNHDDRVSFVEFSAGIGKVAPSIPSETIQSIFNQIDANQDGVVSLDEYLAFCNEHPYLILSVLDAINVAADAK